jgi:hypothetical protein
MRNKTLPGSIDSNGMGTIPQLRLDLVEMMLAISNYDRFNISTFQNLQDQGSILLVYPTLSPRFQKHPQQGFPSLACLPCFASKSRMFVPAVLLHLVPGLQPHNERENMIECFEIAQLCAFIVIRIR